MRSWSDERSVSYVAMSASSTEISLSPEDIPGAVLAEPYTKHTAAALSLHQESDDSKLRYSPFNDLLTNVKHFQPPRSSLHFFRNSVEGYTRIFYFGVATNDACMTCYSSQHSNSSTVCRINFAQRLADTLKILVLLCAL